jgi:nicotinamidase-related amidase
VRTLAAANSVLLVIDVQSRLMPAIEQREAVVTNIRRLLAAATLLDVPVLVTEQNPEGLGAVAPDLSLTDGTPIIRKMTFDACREEGFVAHLPEGAAIAIAGCEAHVCVLQTVLGILDQGRGVFVVRDAIGARRAESKETAIRRMERHGADVVTTEMVIFEWLGTAAHPRFREAIALVK